jgi:hypothetical protein
MRQQQRGAATRPVGQRRSPAERERQRTEAISLHLCGVPVQAIAEKLGVHRNQLGRDIAVAHRDFVESQRMGRVERIAFELAKIDNLERTYWEAWERSLHDSVRVVTAREDFPVDAPTATRSCEGDGVGMPSRQQAVLTKTRAQRRVDERVGNPAFLVGIQWCIDRRVKLLGLDEPVQVDVNAQVRRIAAEMDLNITEVQTVANEVHAIWSGRDHRAQSRHRA